MRFESEEYRDYRGELPSSIVERPNDADDLPDAGVCAPDDYDEPSSVLARDLQELDLTETTVEPATPPPGQPVALGNQALEACAVQPPTEGGSGQPALDTAESSTEAAEIPPYVEQGRQLLQKTREAYQEKVIPTQGGTLPRAQAARIYGDAYMEYEHTAQVATEWHLDRDPGDPVVADAAKTISTTHLRLLTADQDVQLFLDDNALRSALDTLHSEAQSAIVDLGLAPEKAVANVMYHGSPALKEAVAMAQEAGLTAPVIHALSAHKKTDFIEGVVKEIARRTQDQLLATSDIPQGLPAKELPSAEVVRTVFATQLFATMQTYSREAPISGARAHVVEKYRERVEAVRTNAAHWMQPLLPQGTSAHTAADHFGRLYYSYLKNTGVDLARHPQLLRTLGAQYCELVTRLSEQGVIKPEAAAQLTNLQEFTSAPNPHGAVRRNRARSEADKNEAYGRNIVALERHFGDDMSRTIQRLFALREGTEADVIDLAQQHLDKLTKLPEQFADDSRVTPRVLTYMQSHYYREPAEGVRAFIGRHETLARRYTGDPDADIDAIEKVALFYTGTRIFQEMDRYIDTLRQLRSASTVRGRPIDEDILRPVARRWISHHGNRPLDLERLRAQAIYRQVSRNFSHETAEEYRRRQHQV